MDLYAPAGERTITPPRSPRLYDSLDRLSSDCCFSTKKAPPKLCTKDVFFRTIGLKNKNNKKVSLPKMHACMHRSHGLALPAWQYQKTTRTRTTRSLAIRVCSLVFLVCFPLVLGCLIFPRPKLDFFVVVVVVFMIFLEMCRKLRLAQAGRIESKLIVGNWELEGRGPRGPTDRQQLGDGREVLWCKQTCWNKLDTPGGSATIALTHPPWKRLYGRREKQGWVGVKKRT